jgi:DNA-binding GntR family transcriptional regulator
MNSNREQVNQNAEGRRLPRVVLSDRVKEYIVEAVLSGELKPGDRIVVRSFTYEELWETYTVRAALESLAARLATSNLTEDGAERLQCILDQMMEAAHRQDRDRLLQLDNRFHETILDISGNRTLEQLWKTLQFSTWSIVTYRKSSYNPGYLAARHGELLEALKSGNPEKAAHTMQHHIEDMGKPPAEMENDNG